MYSCAVCHSSESREENTEEIFRAAGGKYVLVKDIPATVCTRCGEESFSATTAESIRVMVNGETTPETSISLDVVTFAPTTN